MGRKYFFNENYFENIDTEQKAYWLGFFYADGHITDSSLQCSLKGEDAPHLQLFLDDIKADTIVINYSKGDYNNEVGKINVNSIKMVNDLKKLGFTHCKTYDNNDYIFKCIPDNLKRHFIRGFWDGDGCIQLRQNKFGSINVVSLNQQLLQSFCNYFSNIFNEKDFAKVFISEEKYYRIVIGSERAKKVCNLFYKDSTIYLNRKYQNYLKFKTYDHNYQGIRKRKSGRYQVYMKINYKQVSLGTYDTVKEAVEAYNKAAIQYNRPTQQYYGEDLIRQEDEII